MTAFLEAPFLPAPDQLRIDHITALLAFLTGEPLRVAAPTLLYPKYTPADLTYIWSIWEPHIKTTLDPPPGRGYSCQGHRPYPATQGLHLPGGRNRGHSATD